MTLTVPIEGVATTLPSYSRALNAQIMQLGAIEHSECQAGRRVAKEDAGHRKTQAIPGHPSRHLPKQCSACRRCIDVLRPNAGGHQLQRPFGETHHQTFGRQDPPIHDRSASARRTRKCRSNASTIGLVPETRSRALLIIPFHKRIRRGCGGDSRPTGFQCSSTMKLRLAAYHALRPVCGES